MVKKLIKYDFMSYLRILLPVQLIVIGVALINRIIQFFEPPLTQNGYGVDTGSSAIYNSIFVSSLVLYIISIAVCLLITIIISVVRFYQGMYSSEGYLNHTLPVTASQHIWAKLLTSLLFYLGSLFAVFISFMIITAGDLNIEIFKAAFYLLGKAFNSYGANIALYIIEGIIVLLLSVTAMYLKLYCCLSVGQLAKKRKILLAFGVFFGIYVVKQIIATVFIATAAVNYVFFESISEWISDNGIAFIHILLCGSIVFYAVLSLVYFLINKYLMSKKLNLA